MNPIAHALVAAALISSSVASSLEYLLKVLRKVFKDVYDILERIQTYLILYSIVPLNSTGSCDTTP